MFEEKILDRAAYKKIKAMNKSALSEFLLDIYISGQESAGAAVDLDALREKISAVKGIGEARLNEIMKIIEDETAAAENE